MFSLYHQTNYMNESSYFSSVLFISCNYFLVQLTSCEDLKFYLFLDSVEKCFSFFK